MDREAAHLLSSWIVAVVIVCTLGGCADAEGASGTRREDAGEPDGGAPLEDASAGVDSALLDSTSGPLDGGGSDAATAPNITLDGHSDDAEWAGAHVESSSVATDWAQNELARARALVSGDRLYLAIEGRVEPMNAMVVFVDRDYEGSNGHGDLGALTDEEGSLDAAVSAALSLPAEFRADFAWATQDLGRASEGFDARIGWRDLANPGDFAWIDTAEAPTVCGEAGCETSIAVSKLGASSGQRIAFFARIVSGSGAERSNQSLPEDEGASAGTVTRVAVLPVP